MLRLWRRKLKFRGERWVAWRCTVLMPRLLAHRVDRLPFERAGAGTPFTGATGRHIGLSLAGRSSLGFYPSVFKLCTCPSEPGIRQQTPKVNWIPSSRMGPLNDGSQHMGAVGPPAATGSRVRRGGGVGAWTAAYPWTPLGELPSEKWRVCDSPHHFAGPHTRYGALILRGTRYVRLCAAVRGEALKFGRACKEEHSRAQSMSWTGALLRSASELGQWCSLCHRWWRCRVKVLASQEASAVSGLDALRAAGHRRKFGNVYQTRTHLCRTQDSFATEK